MADVSLKSSTGQDAVAYVLNITAAATPSSGDVLFVTEGQKTRILDRTARGLDFEGNPFAPYSEKGPYYYYPSGKGLGSKKYRDAVHLDTRKAAAKRFNTKTGKLGQLTPGGGIKYESYAAFKRALGRSTVDLLGPSAPHMLMAMVVTADGSSAKIGIYGEESERASGHQDGIPGRLPQRRFLDASKSDVDAMEQELLRRVEIRIRSMV